MEGSPLIVAGDHARAASAATSTSDTTVAIDQHALAAGEFAKAASGTCNAEALRTLRLLEQHHRRISELLRYPTENPPPNTPPTEVQVLAEKPLSTSAAVAELRASKSDIGPRPSSSLRTPPGLHHSRRRPPGDPSSSIASSLASARGIRASSARQPLSPSVSNDQAPGDIEARPRRVGKRSRGSKSVPEHAHPQPSWLPPTPLNAKKSESPSAAPATDAIRPTDSDTSLKDEGFVRFYSTFENIFTKLSAPLAFAAIPFTSNEAPESEPESISPRKRQSSHSRESSPPELEVSKLISRAALRALAGEGYPENESFYVVPTAGHTVSYAQILSFDKKEKRRSESSMPGKHPHLLTEATEEDDFVDARETPSPPSPVRSNFQRSGIGKRRSRHLENRLEELDMENQTLKDIVDKLSKRLSAFEMGAQRSSMALQESIRAIRSASPAREQPKGHALHQEDEGLKQRVLELEEIASSGQHQIEKLRRENDKLNVAVEKYEDRWEKLRVSAKTRREVPSSKETVGKEAALKNGRDPVAGRFVAG
ncbi:hypothetical protein BJ875DRAFT_252406 [Amylocarpus encephaloides]|uniref:Uncharacterized protein n=1 Tax=Amylocarpus encephaloides TaxID=45428 RepID=A0A9P8BZB8_9HELO|nr:hypothetical protein BJ875DRAFT_252406 [Amylocarpus encephaloides]